MARHRTALVLTALLLAAGCLGPAGEPVDDASTNASPQDSPEDENATSDDENRSQPSNATQEDDEDERSSKQDEESGEGSSSEGKDEANASDEPEDPYPPWPSPQEADIRPGVQINAEGQCTSNFLFRTPDNASLLLGVAAHCVANMPEGVSGCSDDVDPLAPGAEVEIGGASKPGTLYYSSLYTMQQENVTDEAACWNNDFALVEIHPADRTSVNPAVQSIGGPTGLAASGDVSVGDTVLWYGATGLTPESEPTSRHEGRVVSSTDWRMQAYSAAPGLPGDSGSGMMLEGGSAAGVLTTLQLVYPGANGAMKLDPALSFAEEYGVEVELVTWPMLE